MKKVLEKANQNKKEFINFIKQNDVVGLSIGVVVGTAVKDLVTSIAQNLIMPLVEVFTPKGNWREITIQFLGATFGVGRFLSALVDFMIAALVIFVIIKKILRVKVDK